MLEFKLNWWQGKPQRSIVCTRKQQPRLKVNRRKISIRQTWVSAIDIMKRMRDGLNGSMSRHWFYVKIILVAIRTSAIFEFRRTLHFCTLSSYLVMTFIQSTNAVLTNTQTSPSSTFLLATSTTESTCLLFPTMLTQTSSLDHRLQLLHY